MDNAIAIAFLVAACFAVAQARFRKGFRGWLLVGLCLGLAGCAYWLAVDGTGGVSRVVLVVTAGTAGDAESLRQQREDVAALVTQSVLRSDRWTSLAWATLGTEDKGDLQWSGADGWKTVHPQAEPATLAVDPADFARSFRLAELRRAADGLLPQRPTLVIVLDAKSPDWNRQAAQSGSLAAAAAGVDVIVWDKRLQDPPGQLRLTLPEEINWAKPFDRGGMLAIDNIPPGSVTQVAATVAQFPVVDGRNQGLGLAMQGPVPIYFGTDHPLSDSEGSRFRYVGVDATLAGREKPLHGGGFVRCVESRVALARAGLDNSYWPRLRWREHFSKSDLESFAAFDFPVGTSQFSYLSISHPLPSGTGVAAAPGTDIERLKNLGGTLVPTATHPVGVILERPGLDDLAAYEPKVKAGLSLLVLDPQVATVPATDPKLAWLPAWPLPAPDGRAPVYHTDARLYLLFDHSKVGRAAGIPDMEVFEKRVQAALETRLTGAWHSPASDAYKLTASLPAITDPPLIVDLPGSASVPENSAPLFLLRPPTLNPPAIAVNPEIGTVGQASHAEEELAGAPGKLDVETEAAHLGFRLWLLFAESGARKDANRLPLLNANEHYENTHVFVFVADVPQPDGLAATLHPNDYFHGVLDTYGFDPFPAALDVKTMTMLSVLKEAGIKVHLVVLRPKEKIDRPSLGNEAVVSPSRLAPYVDEFLAIDEANLATAAEGTAEAIARATTTPPERMSTLRIHQYARVIDLRTENGGAAPWEYSALSTPPPLPGTAAASTAGTVEPPSVYASVECPPAAPSATSAAEPARRAVIAAAPYGRGQVVVCGYSPFALDTWTADSFRDETTSSLLASSTSTFPRSASAVAQYNNGLGLTSGSGTQQYPTGAQSGWGVQRLIDFCDLTCGQAPAYPFARRVDFDHATGTLSLSVDLSPGQGVARPPALTAVSKSGENVGLELVSINAQVPEAVYRVGYEQLAANDDTITVRNGSLLLTVIDLAGPVSRTVDRTLGDAATAWALASGARFVPAQLDSADAQWPLPRVGIVAWILNAVLLLLLLFLWSYRWTTIRQTVIAWARRVAGSRADAVANSLPVDTEAALAEFGFNPGKESPTRIPGEPVGWRLYEPSDPLALARIADLAPYTDLGEALQLPYVRPHVKLRKSLRAYRAEVWLDLHARLQLTPSPDGLTRADYIRALLLLVACNTWNQGGSLRIRSLQRAGIEYGPVTQGSATELEVWHDGLDRTRISAASYDEGLAAGLEEGTRLYIFSDFAYADARFLSLLQDAGATGMQGLRTVRVTDEAELEVGGLHASLPGLTLYDRSDHDPGDLREESTLALRELRNGLDAIPNTRLVDLNTRFVFQDMLLKLEREGFFDE